MQSDELEESRTYQAVDKIIPDQVVYSIKELKSKNLQEYKTHTYVIGTINVEERKRKGKNADKAHEIYVKKPNSLYMFLAKAAQLKIAPTEVISEVHKHTNLCMYHFAGCCPHIECCYSHEEKACGLL